MKKLKDIAKRVTVALLSAALLTNSMDVTALATESNTEKGESVRITGFSELSDTIRDQTLPVGADESEIIFPDSLTVTVEKSNKAEGNSTEDKATEVSNEEKRTEEAADPDSREKDEQDIDGSKAQETEDTGEGSSQEVPVADDGLSKDVSNEDESSSEDVLDESAGASDSGSGNEENGQEESADEEPGEDQDAGNSTAKADILSGVADFFLPPLTVYAAELGEDKDAENKDTAISEEIKIDGIKWVIDADRSSSEKFSSDKAGDKFIYQPEIPDGYTVDATLPTITVTIEEKKEDKETPVFEESKSIDGVKITVSADEGVFPEGAVLSVEKVTKEQERKAEEAVEEKRSEDQNVAVSYTYDIKVLDKDGNEIQPADKSKVKVSFKLEEVSDSNLETNIYHIKEADSDGNVSGERAGNDKADSEEATEGNGADSDSKVSENTELVAEKLEVETDGDTATAETNGFSLYTVEFTYNALQYVMPGNSEVALSEIMDKVGLTGEVTEVLVSDSSLFSAAKNDNGEWVVTAHKVFSSNEWMKVTINDVVYEIAVTDTNGTLAGSGTEQAPYIIADINDWNTFAANINAGTNANAYYKLSDSWDNSSNPVTTMVGIYNSANDKHPFTGTFDGNGKTLTVNLTASTNYCAPFECTNGATFKGLTIAGSITTSQKYAASLSAYNEGTINIMNCHSEAIISSTYSGEGMHGGFMGWNYATLNFTGCSFRGKMLGSSSTVNGGFVGYNYYDNKTSYTDCVFAPTEITMGTNKSYTFDRLAKSFNNAYYTQAFGNAQGKLVYADIPDNTVYSTVMQDYNLSYYLPVTVSGVRASYIATGSNIHPEPTVKTADGTVLTKGTHYNVTYSSENDKDAGNYTLTVTGISPYSGLQVISYEVKSVNLNITSANDWNQFATNVNDGNDYSGVTVTLGNNISVSTMVGTSDNRFMGTFDGGNHTITFTKTDASTNDCAPFGYIEGATIKDLTVAGSITTSAKYGASLAAHTYGETNITNCHSTVTITGSNSGDGTHGGFVAVNEGSATLNFNGCSFKGKMLGSNATSNGGFVGYNSGTKINYTDCLFAPTEITMSASSSCTFNRNGKNSFTRTYYTQAFGTAEGEKVYATIPAGATTESVSAADGNTYYRVTGYQTITVITSADDWEAFANSVNEGGVDYSDVTVTLGANINVSTMVGTSSRQFKGTFEGAGHTLTLSLTNDGGECTAPFRYVNGASFANLRTAGTVNGGGQKYATGLIGQSAGTVGISSCRSSVQITSSVSGDATHGGFIGVADGTVTFTNCLFDGSITGASATNCGGFVGWRGGTLAFNNCLMAGTMSLSSTSGCATFNRNGSATFNKCYYRTAYGDVQGDAVGSMSNETLIDSDHLGSGWEISGSDVIPVIGKKTIALATVSGLYRNYLYTGSEISISYIVTADDNTVLVKGTDYTEAITKDGSASAVKDKGDYTLTISGAGNYSGSQTFRFTVRDAIEYVESNGTEKTVNPQAVTAIEEGNKPIVMSAGWYFVQESTTISERITVSGDVKLILGDGTALTVPKGIRVEENNSLTIYSQSEGNGSLTINGVDTHNAGIGGNGGFHYDENNYNGHNAGSITIHGGIITATGGYCGAGIGGGGSARNKGGSGGNITIDGGTVTAYGYASAAIGGGGYGSVGKGGSSGTIIISGGKVTAHSGNREGGEGIGGCYGNTDGTITLNCTKNDDFVQSSSYVGSVSVVSGVKLYDDDGHAYTGTLSNAQIANKKLGLGWAVSISNGITHGTVTADKAGVRAAAENKTVTLTVTPDAGYSIASVSYNDGSDHEITPDENGKYKFTMPAKDVTVSAMFKKSLTHTDISVNIPAQEYTGNALTPAITVKDGDTTLKAGVDYTIGDWSDTLVNAGTYTTTLTGIDKYVGTRTANFIISPKTINNLNIQMSGDSYTYERNEIRPEINIEGIDSNEYSVSYSNNINVGTGTVTITNKDGGNYQFEEITKNFTITPKEVTVSGITANEKEYDGTTTASLVYTDVTITGKIDEDDLTVSATGTFEGANAGTDKTVNISGLTLGGAAANNYVLAANGQQTSTKANITKIAAYITTGTTSFTKTFGDAPFALTGISVTPADAAVAYTVSESKDAVGETVDNNKVVTVNDSGTVTIVGAGSATITVSLPEGTNYNAAESKTILITVHKKTADEVSPIDRTYLYTAGGSDSITLSSLLPSDCGKTGYSVAKTGSVTYSSEPVVSDGVLSYTVNSGTKGTTGTITVSVSTANYADITITVNVSLVDKKQVALKDGSTVALNKSVLTYGEALSTLTFKNTAVFVEQGNTSNVIEGTIAWQTPEAVPVVGTTSATWKFTPTDNEYSTLTGEVAITVNKASSSVTTAPAAKENLTYDGTQKALVSEGTANGGTMMYCLEKDGTYQASAPTGINAGDYKVWYYVQGDENHSDTTKQSVSVSIAQATPDIGTVTADDLNDTTEASSVVLHRSVETIQGTLELTSTSLKYGTNENCNWKFTPTDTTNYKTITGTVTVNVKDTIAPTGEVSIKENKWSSFLNTITFGWYQLTDKVKITSTDSGSGVDKVYYFINKSETPLTEAEVTAKTEGWEIYGSAFSISQDMKCIIYVKIVDKAGNTTYISSNGLGFDGTAPAISGATDGASYVYGMPVALSVTDAGELASVKINDVTENTSDAYTKSISDAGSYTVTATDKAGNTSTISFSITKAPITLGVTIDGWIYGESAKTPEVTRNTGNGIVTYEYKLQSAADTAYTTAVPTNAGAYTLRATVAATANYQGGTATANFTISKATITPSISISGWTYGGTASTPTVTGNSGNGTVTYEYKKQSEADTAYTSAVPKNAGDYSIRATIAESTNYQGGSATATFTIVKGMDPAIVTTTATLQKGGKKLDLSKLVSSAEGTVSFAFKDNDSKGGCSLAGNTLTSGANEGTAIIKVTIADSNNCNGRNTDEITVSIVDKETKSLAVTQDDVTYGGTAVNPSYTEESGATNKSVTYTGTLRKDGSAYSSSTAPTEAGSYSVTVSYDTDTDIYSGSKTFTIKPLDIKNATVTLDDTALTYTGSAQTKSVNKVKVDNKEIDKSNYEVTGNTGTNAGSYTVIVTAKDSSNYIGTATEEFTIAKVSLNVTADAKTKKYGQADPTLTYSVTGFVNSETADSLMNGSLTRVAGENVGTYAIEKGTLSFGNNYSISFTGANLTITKADGNTNKPAKPVFKEKTNTSISVNTVAGQEYSITNGTNWQTFGVFTGLTANTEYNIITRVAETANVLAGASSDALMVKTSEKAGQTTENIGNLSQGEIDIEKIVGEGVPSGTVSGMTTSLAESLLTNEEKTAVQTGSTLIITAQITNIDNTVSADDKSKTEAKAAEIAGSDVHIGVYLDISIFKQIGSGARTAVHDTHGNKIAATIEIPVGLRNTKANVTRTFYIIRVHNGVATKLAETTGNTITAESDLFSTFALVYADKTNDSGSGSGTGEGGTGGGGTGGGGGGTTPTTSTFEMDQFSSYAIAYKDSNRTTAPKTGDSGDIRIWYLLLIASLGGLGLIGFSKKCQKIKI